MTVKQPFVPAINLDEIPTPSEDYAIVVLPAEEGDDPYVFEDGSTAPLSALASGDIVSEAHTPTVDGEASDDASSQGSPSSSPESLTWEKSKERFIEECLFTANDLETNPELEETAIISNGDLVLPKGEAVDAFNMWQEEHLNESQLPNKPKNTSRFTRDILTPYANDHGIEVETARRTLDGNRLTCYKEFGLTEHGRKIL